MKKLNFLTFNIRKLKMPSKLFGVFLPLFILLNINSSFGLTDSQKKSLIEKAWVTVFNEPQMTIDFCQSVISDKSIENDSAFIAEIYRIIGTGFFNISEYSKSIEYYTKSLTYFYSKNNQQKIADLNNDIAQAYTLINKISEAIQYFNNALTIFKKFDKKKEQSFVFGNIGICYYYKLDYVNAVSNFLRALIIADKLKDKKLIALHISNIGMIYRQLKNYDKSLTYYKKALKTFTDVNNLPAVAAILNNTANVLLDQGKLDESLNLCNQSIEIKKKINNKIGIALSLNVIGEIYEKKENYPEALNFYNQSLKMKEEINHASGAIFTTGCIGRIYNKQKDLRKAELTFLRAVELGKINKIPTKTAHYFLSEIYKQKNDFENSLYHLKKFGETEDTVIGPDKINEINELLANYENLKKDEEITNLSETNQLQEKQIRDRTIFIVVLVLLISILIVMFITIFRYSKEVERSKIELSESNQKLTEALNDLHIEIESRKKVEKDLLVSQEKLAMSLEQAKELNELKTRFISMISHEYRNPLTVILNATELLPVFNRLKNKEQHEKYLLMIRQQVDVMVKLLNDVLIIGKKGSAELKPNPMKMPLVDVCKDVITNISFIDENKHNFILNPAPNIGLIYTDLQYLNTILSNLLLNSIKYSPYGTDIEIDITENGDLYKIAIKDKGIGIPDNDKPHIFEPFFRGSNIGIIPGNGLGLGIAKMFLELLGGTIEFDSKENFGTTFYLTIPKSL